VTHLPSRWVANATSERKAFTSVANATGDARCSPAWRMPPQQSQLKVLLDELAYGLGAGATGEGIGSPQLEGLPEGLLAASIDACWCINMSL